MSRIVSIGSVSLNESLPVKLTVPVMGATRDEVIEEGRRAKDHQVDLVEWRLDFFDGVEEPVEVARTYQDLQETLGEIPIILTLRTEGEGGRFPEVWPRYQTILLNLCDLSGPVAIDIQYRCPENLRDDIMGKAKSQKVVTILSYHQMAGVPEMSELLQLVDGLSQTNPSLIKLACQVNTETELVRLNVIKDHWQMLQPMCVIGMGELGVETRIDPQNVLTFAKMNKSSAPGQLTVDEFRMKSQTKSLR